MRKGYNDVTFHFIKYMCTNMFSTDDYHIKEFKDCFHEYQLSNTIRYSWDDTEEYKEYYELYKDTIWCTICDEAIEGHVFDNNTCTTCFMNI